MLRKPYLWIEASDLHEEAIERFVTEYILFNIENFMDSGADLVEILDNPTIRQVCRDEFLSYFPVRP